MTDWLFQADPKRYDLVAAVRTGVDENWSMNQARSRVHVGDRVFFYLSGKQAGIYAVGNVTTRPYDAGLDAEYGRWKVGIQYTAEVAPPLLKADLAKDPITGSFYVFRGMIGTNFVVPSDVANALASMLIGRLSQIKVKKISPFDKVWQAIEAHQQHVKDQLLDRLHDLEPATFEGLIAQLLEVLGYEDVMHIGGSGDGGVDVTAVLRLHGMTALSTVIQVKRWRQSVPVDVIRNLRGSLRVDERGVVVTTSEFTPQAVTEANALGKSPIGLVNGGKLVDLLVERRIGVRSRNVALLELEEQPG